MTAAAEARPRRWIAVLTSGRAAAVVLAAFWALMLASLRDKSIAYDEIAQATAGYTYWTFNDYRIDPPNGNLPKRLMAMPLLGGKFQFPPRESDVWRESDAWRLGDAWFHDLGNDERAMLARGHAVMGLVAIALGALVWWQARRHFGPAAGMIALLLFVLNPAVLANGALMTSDMMAAFFFFAATVAIAAVLRGITWGRVAASTLAVAGLFLSKMSAPLIVPVALLLVVARLAQRTPLPVAIGGRRELCGWWSQGLVLAALALVHVAVAGTAVWTFYGFRYAALSDAGSGRLPYPWSYLLDKPGPTHVIDALGLTADQRARINAMPDSRSVTLDDWTHDAETVLRKARRDVLTAAQVERLDRFDAAPPPALTARAIDFCRRHELLPESFLYGYAHGWRFSRERVAFLNGEVRMGGWRSFFPYTFAVKTPLPMLALLVIAGAAAWWARRTTIRNPELLAPLALVAVYGAAAMASHMNIGHRHLLPVFAPLFVLAGVAATARWARLAAVGVVVSVAAEVCWRFPNYRAYFNGLVRPAEAYRHLVDSSLDWGQELPAVKRWLDAHPDSGHVYFSYFGTGSPPRHEIPATALLSEPGHHIKGEAVMLARTVIGGETAVLQQWPDHELVAIADEGNARVLLLVKRPAALRLLAGTYLISATMLQPLYYTPWGSWNAGYERTYQALAKEVRPLLGEDRAARSAALQRHEPEWWQATLRRFEEIRFARLTAFLRRRAPDDEINFAVLVYRLSDADIASALEGPSPEG
jgi:hypothetical protein